MDPGTRAKGLLLASLTLRLRGDGEGEGSRPGTLDFLADDLLDSFCMRHDLAGPLLARLARGDAR